MKLKELFEDWTPFGAKQFITYVNREGARANTEERFIARLLQYYGECELTPPKPEQPKITALDEARRGQYEADGGLLRRKAIFDLKKFGYIDPRSYAGFIPNSELEEDERAISIWMRGYIARCEQSPVTTELTPPGTERIEVACRDCGSRSWREIDKQPEQPKPEPEAWAELRATSKENYGDSCPPELQKDIVDVFEAAWPEQQRRIIKLINKVKA